MLQMQLFQTMYNSWLLFPLTFLDEFNEVYCNQHFMILLWPNHSFFTSLFQICRLFSCGTDKEGDSHLVEWNETEGAIKRTYSGFRKRSVGVIQFDTSRNRFLAAGDEFMIKFWDMDNTNILKTADADGGLPVSTIISIGKLIFIP